MDRPLRKIHRLRLQVQLPKRLLVLRHVLPQHVPQRLCLLRAQKDRALVLDRHLVRRVAGSSTEDQLEIPDTDANLHAVRVSLAIFGRLRHGYLRLCVWIHGSPSLLPPAGESKGVALREALFSSVIPMIAAKGGTLNRVAVRGDAVLMYTSKTFS